MRKTPIRKVSGKQRVKNAQWRKVILARAEYLIKKYGYLLCEYSGERINGLSGMGDDLNAGWGHHINRNRKDNTSENCYICKYKYHTIITDNNIMVSQEDFINRELFL